MIKNRDDIKYDDKCGYVKQLKRKDNLCFLSQT